MILCQSFFMRLSACCLENILCLYVVMGRHASAAPGADEVEPQKVISRLQCGSSYDFIVTAGTAAAAAQTHQPCADSFSGGCHGTSTGAAVHQAAPARKQAAKQVQHGPANNRRMAAQPQPQPQTQAQPKERKTCWVGGRSAPAFSFCTGCSPELFSMSAYPHLASDEVHA